MPDETYNGWTNRETWLVNLWLTNDQVTSEAANEICRHESVDLAQVRLEDFVSDMYEGQTGLIRALLDSALVRVDWLEIVESFRAD